MMFLLLCWFQLLATGATLSPAFRPEPVIAAGPASSTQL